MIDMETRVNIWQKCVVVSPRSFLEHLCEALPLLEHGEGDFWRAMAEWHGDHGMWLEAQEEGSAQDEGVGAWMESIGTSQGGFSFSYVGSFLQGTKFKNQE
jgi:hypothetical protein